MLALGQTDKTSTENLNQLSDVTPHTPNNLNYDIQWNSSLCLLQETKEYVSRGTHCLL